MVTMEIMEIMAAIGMAAGAAGMDVAIMTGTAMAGGMTTIAGIGSPVGGRATVI